jgi:hypothetical protein
MSSAEMYGTIIIPEKGKEPLRPIRQDAGRQLARRRKTPAGAISGRKEDSAAPKLDGWPALTEKQSRPESGSGTQNSASETHFDVRRQGPSSQQTRPCRPLASALTH